VVVPCPTPDKVPDALIVAAAGLEDNQGVEGCAVPEPESDMVDPTQTSVGPLIEHTGLFFDSAKVPRLTNSKIPAVMLLKKLLLLRVRSHKGYLVDSLFIIG
jgi:hypothetical protein